MKRRSSALTAGASLLVSLLDAAQPILLEWRPKFFVTIAGALLYFGLAMVVLGALRGPRKLALGILAAMPILPVSALIAASLGAPAPVDAGMIVVMGAQILAAMAASRTLWLERAPQPSAAISASAGEVSGTGSLRRAGTPWTRLS